MDLSTTFRHMEPTDALRDYAHQKVSRLQKYLRQPMTARVTLSAEKNEHGVEIQITSGGQHFESHEVSGDMYASIDSTAHKLGRQIQDAKGVASARRRRDADLRRSSADPSVLAAAPADQ